MNPYQFVRSSRVAVEQKTLSSEDVKNAVIINDIDAILEASVVAGKYEFTKDEKLTKALQSGISEMSRTIETLADGVTEVNRISAVYKGVARRFRVFGSKIALPEKEYTADEIKKSVFGFCSSNGEIVTETKVGANGIPAKYPVIYLQMA